MTVIKRLLFVGPVLGLLLCATPALAQSASASTAPARVAGDRLVLRDGSVLVGTLAERRADGSVTWLSADGRTLTFTSDQVTSVSFGGVVSSDQPTPVPAPAPQQPALEMPSLERGPGRTPIDFVSTGRPLQIGVVSGFEPHLQNGSVVDRATGDDLCSTPCRLYFPRNRIAMWAGHRGFMHYNFLLGGADGEQLIRLRAARAGLHGWGPPLILLGVVVDVLGGALVATSRPGDGAFTSGIVILGAGSSFIVGAVLIYALNQPGFESQSPIEHSVSFNRSRARPLMRVGFAPIERGGAANVAVAF